MKDARELQEHLNELVRTFQQDHKLRITEIRVSWDHAHLDSYGDIEYETSVVTLTAEA